MTLAAPLMMKPASGETFTIPLFDLLADWDPMGSGAERKGLRVGDTLGTNVGKALGEVDNERDPELDATFGVEVSLICDAYTILLVEAVGDGVSVVEQVVVGVRLVDGNNPLHRK